MALNNQLDQGTVLEVEPSNFVIALYGRIALGTITSVTVGTKVADLVKDNSESLAMPGYHFV
jgi:hypothetical protein